MTKAELWGKYELFDLFKDLEYAEEILSKIKGGHSTKFNSAEEFHQQFIEELHDVKGQNTPDFEQIRLWFAPTSTWDDFVGLDGAELANRIYERAEKWNKNNISHT